jgi:hypothetical protein
MVKLLITLALSFFWFSISFAGVEISDFSFVGKEVSDLTIKPVYKNISVDFKSIKSFDTYIDKLNLEVKDVTRDEYSAKDPGFMYSGKFGTALSSAFIGSRAYRNYLAKMYLQKDYLNVIQGFEQYEEKLTGSDFKDECTFLYAISLMNVGYYEKSIGVLNNLKLKENFFGNLALEFLFDYYKNISDIENILKLAEGVARFTPYSLYVYVDTLFGLDKYQKIVDIIGKNIEIANKYKFFYDYFLYSKYVLKDYSSILENEEKGTVNSYPVLIDVYLSKGDLSKASGYIDQLEDTNLKNYFLIKKKIYKGDFLEAISDISTIKDENYLANLFFELVTKGFYDIEASYIDRFNFKNPQNIDYKNFYKGLLLLNQKEYLKSASAFEKITFNEFLMESSYFYKGLDYFYVNRDLSEANLKRYILKAKDQEKLNSARYLLGQIYLGKNQLDTALIVLENCSTYFCQELKGEIFIANKEYDIALEYLNSIDTDRGNYLKSVVAFNRKKYSESLNYLNKIKKPDEETDYLLMSVYFKLDQYEQAYKLALKYLNNEKFFDTAVNYYFLKGDYSTALYFIDRAMFKDDKYLLLKAKSLYSLKRYSEAEIIFNKFVNENKYIYDSIFGLINIKRAKGQNEKYIDEIFELIKNRNFERKDSLIIELVKESIGQNKLQNAIYLINYYFDNFKSSKNNKDAYLLRGDIFKKLGRYEECTKDTDYVINKFKNDYEAYLLKAECLEQIDKTKSIAIYENLLENENYKILSSKRLLKLYDDPDRIIKLAGDFLESEPTLYFDSVLRALKIVGDSKNIVKYKAEIDNLLVSNIKEYVIAGLYFSSLKYFYENDYKNTIKYSMKAYYLDKNSEFNKLSLENAIRAYESIGNKQNAEKVQKILKELNRGS